MWWTIEYYDKHKLPLDDLIIIRKKTENMAPGICGAIRNSLKKIYPTHKKYVDVISIEEVENNNTFWQPRSMLSNSVMSSSDNSGIDNFRKIKLRYEVKASFEIK